MVIPTVGSCLPELMDFVERLGSKVESDDLTSWPSLSQEVRRFFGVEQMAKVNAIVPGWQAMAADAEGQTLIHVMAASTALLLCPEYRQVPLEMQHVMQWIVLLHDLAKEVHDGKRDPTHGFRSAALTGQLLRHFLDTATGDFEGRLTKWVALIRSAKTRPPEADIDIPDNRRLPEIVDGIDSLFGQDTPAALIVKTILFHQALDVVAEWPQAAPLTQQEIQRYLGPRVVPYLKMLMLVDNDAWAFFDPETKQRHRTETLTAFRKVETLVHGTPS
jgi:hypothetical protein